MSTVCKDTFIVLYVNVQCSSSYSSAPLLPADVDCIVVMLISANTCIIICIFNESMSRDGPHCWLTEVSGCVGMGLMSG